MKEQTSTEPVSAETELQSLRSEVERLREERDAAQKDFKLYAGLFSRIRDQIIGGYGPAEMIRWTEAVKANDKGEGRVDAVATLITYFYKLCDAKSKVESARDALKSQNAELVKALEHCETMFRELRYLQTVDKIRKTLAKTGGGK